MDGSYSFRGILKARMRMCSSHSSWTAAGPVGAEAHREPCDCGQNQELKVRKHGPGHRDIYHRVFQKVGHQRVVEEGPLMALPTGGL